MVFASSKNVTSLLFVLLSLSSQRFDTVAGQPKIGDWNKIGDDINGEANEDAFGVSVTMSNDGKTIAVGAPGNDGSGFDAGHVRVFKLDATDQYRQYTMDINAKFSGDQFGSSLTMSADGKTIAVGAKAIGTNFLNDDDSDDGTTIYAGYVQVFRLDTLTIVQYRKIVDILGEFPEDFFGYSVAMSEDGGTFIVGAPGNDSSGENSGHARVFKLDSSPEGYTQVGPDLNGVGGGDLFGLSVAMSADGTRIAVGGIYGTDNTGRYGQVRAYKLDVPSNQYRQIGTDIYGEVSTDLAGASLAMSADGNTIAVGAIYNEGNGRLAGHVRVHKINSLGQYVPIGFDIEGEAAFDEAGTSVAMSADGNTIAVGAPGNDGNGSESGHVRVFKLNSAGTQYNQIGSDIDGEVSGDQFGTSLDMSSDGTMIVVGGILNDGNGKDSGHVRAYRYLSSNPITPVTPTPPTKPPTRKPTIPPKIPCRSFCFVKRLLCSIIGICLD